MIHPHYSLSVWYTDYQRSVPSSHMREKERGCWMFDHCFSTKLVVLSITLRPPASHKAYSCSFHRNLNQHTNAQQRVRLCSSLSIRFLTTALQSMPRPPRGLVFINHGASEDLLVTREKAAHWPRLAVNVMMSRKVEPYSTGKKKRPN